MTKAQKREMYALLHEWLRWSRKDSDGSAGFQSRSIESRLADNLGVMIGPTGKAPGIFQPESVARTEEALSALKSLSNEGRRMFWALYIDLAVNQPTRARIAVYGDMMRAHGMLSEGEKIGTRKYFYMLECARLFLLGFIRARCSIKDTKKEIKK